MKKYTITGSPVRLNGGLLGLTEKQAAPRLHHLKPLKKKGLFEIVQPVVFKAGEVIGFDGDIPKSQAKLMVSDADKEQSDADLEAQRLAEEQAAAEAEAARIAAEEAAKNQANSNQGS